MAAPHAVGPAAVVVLLALAPASSAGAADLSDYVAVYTENYEGEVAFPTTPDYDLLASGAQVFGLMTPSQGAPTFNGTDVQIALTSAGDTAGVTGLDHPEVGTLDHLITGRFRNLSITGDGTVLAGLIDSFTPAGVGGLVDVLLSVEVAVVGGVASATLHLTERDEDDIVVATSSIALSGAAAAALVAGNSFIIELCVDPSTNTASGEIGVSTGGNFAVGPIALTLIGEHWNFVQAFQLDPGMFPSAASVDYRSTQLFLELPFEPAFNIDVGADHGTPASSFAAAGQAGTWNTVATGANSLVRADGSPSFASVNFVGGSEASTVANPPDVGPLLNDHIEDCTDPREWSLDFTGLDDGAYRVIVYAPSDTDVGTGVMDIGGSFVPAINGDAGSALVLGASYTTVVVPVSGGALTIAGSGGASPPCKGPAGVQLERYGPPVSVPVGAWPVRALLAAMLCWASWNRQSSTAS